MISGTAQEVKAISQLPLAFYNVPPAVLRVNDPIVPEPPSGYIRLEDGMMTPADVREEEEFQWLRNAKELASKATLEKTDFISWQHSMHVVYQQQLTFPQSHHSSQCSTRTHTPSR